MISTTRLNGNYIMMQFCSFQPRVFNMVSITELKIVILEMKSVFFFSKTHSVHSTHSKIITFLFSLLFMERFLIIYLILNCLTLKNDSLYIKRKK